MRYILATLFGLLIWAGLPAYASFTNSTLAYDVRATGSDANGGCFDSGVASPGTDFSQQDSAQVAFTDLVIGSTNTQLTSAANAFSSTSVGNCVQITGGTGFTTGIYLVVSVSGSTATMDRAVGTASSTAGTGNLGGSLLTVGKAMTTWNVETQNHYETIWVKSGTYTITSGISINPSIANYIGIVEGYGTTHGDFGTPPLITTATNSVQMFSWQQSNEMVFTNLHLSNTAATRGDGFYSQGNEGTVVLVRTSLDGFRYGINGQNTSGDPFSMVYLYDSEIKNSTVDGIVNNSGVSVWLLAGSNLHNNALGVSLSNTQFYCDHSLLTSNSGAGVVDISNHTTTFVSTYCTYASNLDSGIDLSVGVGATGLPMQISNNIFYNNTNYGVKGPTSSLPLTNPLAATNNAYGSNSVAAKLNFADTNPITLTVSPFAVGSGNYALNTTAGGGALVRAAGYPGVYASGATTSYPDVGAAQSNGGGSAAVVNSGYVN